MENKDNYNSLKYDPIETHNRLVNHTSKDTRSKKR